MDLRVPTRRQLRNAHDWYLIMRMTHGLSDLDLNLLRALDALLRHAHVTRAAAELGVTQSAASRSLARLREVFGDELLVRSGRGLRRTPHAEALQPAVARVLADVGRLLQTGPAFDPATAQRTFRLYAADYYAIVAVPHVARALAAEAPGVNLEVVPADRPLVALEEGRIDVVVSPTGTLDSAEVARTLLFKEDLVVLLRADHPALDGPWTREVFASLDHVLVAPMGTSQSPVSDRLARHGLRRRVSALTYSFASAPHIVAHSDRVVTFPRRAAAVIGSPLGLVERELPVEQPGFQLAAFWHERMRRDPAHAWFRHLLRRCVPA